MLHTVVDAADLQLYSDISVQLSHCILSRDVFNIFTPESVTHENHALLQKHRFHQVPPHVAHSAVSMKHSSDQWIGHFHSV